MMWDLFVQQIIAESYEGVGDEMKSVNEKLAKKMFELLRNSETKQMLADIARPVGVKKLSDEELHRHTCCGPFPNLKD